MVRQVPGDEPHPSSKAVEIADSLEERFFFAPFIHSSNVAGPFQWQVSNFHFAEDFRVHSERRENQA